MFAFCDSSNPGDSMKFTRCAILLLFAVWPLAARQAALRQSQQQTESTATALRPPAPRAGYRAEYLADLDDVQKKYMDLAGAVPADKYLWRPAKGVRSISEVYMHIAGANYFLTSFLGVKPPADIPKDFETITDKPRVLAEMQRSFDQLRGVVLTMADADLEKMVMLDSLPATQRRVLTRILTHLHEHLGQSIAYARINRIVPPWSRKDY
jgi:uncharacterized damage-inducible protein DinB